MVPVTVLVKAIDGAVPEQTVCEDGVAVTTGVGFTVMVTVIGVPEQPPAVGVIVYIAVPATVEVAVSVWAMVEPLLEDAPETFVCTTVQA